MMFKYIFYTPGTDFKVEIYACDYNTALVSARSEVLSKCYPWLTIAEAEKQLNKTIEDPNCGTAIAIQDHARRIYNGLTVKKIYGDPEGDPVIIYEDQDE